MTKTVERKRRAQCWEDAKRKAKNDKKASGRSKWEVKC